MQQQDEAHMREVENAARMNITTAEVEAVAATMGVNPEDLWHELATTSLVDQSEDMEALKEDMEALEEEGGHAIAVEAYRRFLDDSDVDHTKFGKWCYDVGPSILKAITDWLDGGVEDDDDDFRAFVIELFRNRTEDTIESRHSGTETGGGASTADNAFRAIVKALKRLDIELPDAPNPNGRDEGVLEQRRVW